MPTYSLTDTFMCDFRPLGDKEKAAFAERCGASSKISVEASSVPGCA